MGFKTYKASEKLEELKIESINFLSLFIKSIGLSKSTCSLNYKLTINL